MTSGREVVAVEAVKRVSGQDKEVTDEKHKKAKTKKIVGCGYLF